MKASRIMAIVLGMAVLALVNTSFAMTTAAGGSEKKYAVHPQLDLEKLKNMPPTKYITVDTPNGAVNVPDEILKSVGKDKIAKKYADYLKIENEFKQFDEQQGYIKLEPSAINDLSNGYWSATQTSASSPNALLDFNIAGRHDERHYLFPNTGSATLLSGTIYPLSYSNSGEIFTAYSEREIFYGSYDYNDCIEVIAAQCDDPSSRNKMYIVLYDEDVSGTQWLISVSNAVNAMSYSVYSDTMDNSYNMMLTDQVTGQRYFYTYPDNNFHPNIFEADASSELIDGSTDYVHNFYLENSISDYYTKVNGYIAYPGQVFNIDTNPQNVAYTYARATTDGYAIYSTHKMGYPDPS